MKTQDILLIGAVALGGYLLFKSTYGGTSKTEAARSLSSSGAKVSNSVFNPGTITATYEGTNWGQTNTTYFFSPEEYSRFNWAQQLLSQIPIIPKSWIFGA